MSFCLSLENFLIMNIWVEILIMMAFCFAIGFGVAGIIKFIAVAADRLEFFRSHSSEYRRLKRLEKEKYHHLASLTHFSRTFKPKDYYDDAVPPDYFFPASDKYYKKSKKKEVTIFDEKLNK